MADCDSEREENLAGPLLESDIEGDNIMETETPRIPSEPIPVQFCHLTQEYDVCFFTGLTTTGTFITLYGHVFSKSSVMSYWEGPKTTSLLQNNQINDRLDSVEEMSVLPEHGTFPLKREPSRKFSNERELILTLMKLRLGLLTDDSASASDKHIVRDSGFYDILQPFDQVMADRGFKLKTDLAMIQC